MNGGNIMRKIPAEYLTPEKIIAFVDENSEKKLCELYDVKEDYDVSDMDSRYIEQLDLSPRTYNFLKRFKKEGIGKGFEPNENLLLLTVGELKSVFKRFIGMRGIIETLEKLNDFLKDE